MVQFTDTVSNLGVVVDSQLNMSAHVTAVRRSCVFKLRQLWAVTTLHIDRHGEDFGQRNHQQ